MQRKSIIVIVLLFFLTSCQNLSNQEAKITASFFPIYSLVHEISSEPVVIIMDSDAHDCELSSGKRMALSKSELFFYHGQGFEPWFKEDMLVQGKSYALAETIEPIQGDPHTWLDPNNALVYLEKIASVLDEHEYLDHKKYKLIHEELSLLIQEYDDVLLGESSEILMVDHMAYAYLSERYELIQKPIISGVSEGEASFKEMIASIEWIRENNISFIFVDPNHNNDVINEVIKETGVQALPLYTMEQGKDKLSYPDMLRLNLESLKVGIGHD